jgi:excinuclease ABC subunit A
MEGVSHNNLRGVDVEIPLGLLVCVTGVSGSGKSSLVGDVLEPALREKLGSEAARPGEFTALLGADEIDKVIVIDQSPIGRTPRSNPATYVKVWDDIRNLLTMLPDAKTRGWKAGRFSFNVAGGRCEACEGNGSVRLDMDFLADVWVTCETCGGARFSRDTLEVRWKGKNVADLLGMEIGDARTLFADAPDIARKLETLCDVGLDYLHLGQPSPTLSGGEAQRVKLSRELAKRSTGRERFARRRRLSTHQHEHRQAGGDCCAPQPGTPPGAARPWGDQPVRRGLECGPRRRHCLTPCVRPP